MQEAISSTFLIIGALFILIAALGVLRFPDLFIRVSASTTASTLGVGFLLLALAVHFNELGITMRSLATAGFLIISAPVAAHLISSSAYSAGVRLWEKTVTDELQGRYDSGAGTLESIELDEESIKD